MRSRIKGISFAAVFFAMILGAFALVGCANNSNESTLTPEIVSEMGAYKVTAKNAAEKAAVMSSNVVEAEEGQVIVISSDVQEGEFRVVLTDESDKKVADKKVSEQALEVCEVDPGKYSVEVTCNTDVTTGTVLVCPVDSDEFEKQGQDLDATLAAMAEE